MPRRSSNPRGDADPAHAPEGAVAAPWLGAAAQRVTATQLGLRGAAVLWQVGPVPPPPRVAIVGSRAALAASMDAARRLTDAAAAAGWSVVSGGALGVDGAVHRAALKAGVPQIAVLPCGPDRPYPPRHAPLFRDMHAAGAGLLFAYPAATAPTRGAFASRNRFVVGLCDAVVVVQAGLRSGSMLTASIATARRRPLAICPGSPGCDRLRARGAVALPRDPDTLAGALAEFLETRGAARDAGPWPAPLAALREAFANAPGGLAAASLPPAQLLALVRAEAAALVVEASPGRWVAPGISPPASHDERG